MLPAVSYRWRSTFGSDELVGDAPLVAIVKDLGRDFRDWMRRYWAAGSGKGKVFGGSDSGGIGQYIFELQDFKIDRQQHLNPAFKSFLAMISALQYFFSAQRLSTS